MPYTEEELLNKLDALPEDVKDAIFDVQTSELLVEIGNKYSLHIDKVGELVNETGLVLVGITHPKDYVANLEKRLGVDRMTARKIAEEVNEQIFKKVRESLKKMHGIQGEEALAKEAPPAPAEITALPTKPAPPPPEAILLKPLEIRPAPGMAFEEKTQEKVFRTPSEIHERNHQEPKKTMENVEFKELKPKYDPYRESIE